MRVIPTPFFAQSSVATSTNLVRQATSVVSRLPWKPGLGILAAGAIGFSVYKITTQFFPNSPLAKLFQRLFPAQDQTPQIPCTRRKRVPNRELICLFSDRALTQSQWTELHFGNVSKRPDDEEAMTDQELRWMRRYSIHEIEGSQSLRPDDAKTFEKGKQISKPAFDTKIQLMRDDLLSTEGRMCLNRKVIQDSKFYDQLLATTDNATESKLLWQQFIPENLTRNQQLIRLNQSILYVPTFSEVSGSWGLLVVDFKRNKFSAFSSAPNSELMTQCTNLSKFIATQARHALEEGVSDSGLSIAYRNLVKCQSWDLEHVQPQDDMKTLPVDSGISVLRMIDQLKSSREADLRDAHPIANETPFLRMAYLYDVLHAMCES